MKPPPLVPRWVNPFRTARNLETLEEFRMTLEQQLSGLSDCPLVLTDHFKGFHSSIKPTRETFPVQNKESSIALYPAIHWNGEEPEVYAFPKRFIITALPTEGGDPIIVADWSQTDFPQQSLMPAIFPFPWGNYGGVHITVLKGVPMPGGHAFALSEVAFGQIDDTEPIYLRTQPENSLEARPHWSADYATDGRTAFGFPASAENPSTNGTFHLLVEKSDVPQIVIRQSKPSTWKWLEFYPTSFATGAPPRGFPARIHIEFSNRDDFSELVGTA